MNANWKISLLNVTLSLWIMGTGCAQAQRSLVKITGKKPLDDFQQAEILYQENKYDQAFQRYHTFIQQHPRDDRTPQAQLRQSRILFKQQKYIRSSQLLERFLKQYPDHPQASEALKKLGLSYYQQGKYHQAITNLKKLLSRYPREGSYEIYSVIARSFFKLNDYENALVHFKSLMDRYPEVQATAELKYDLGMAAFSLGKDQLAWENLQEISKAALSPEENINLQLMLAKLA